MKHIIVHDIQTREKFYFLCEKWLALDKEDGQLERVLLLSTQKDKTNLNYLLPRRIKNKLRDDHLWFSILARPIQSSFTRLDRLTCCFVLLSISMLINIMYYEIEDSNTTNQDGLKIGPYINLTTQQISIGILSSLFVLVPSFLLVQLFRRIRRRQTRLSKINALLKQDKRKKHFELKFPWWFKIIAYLLSFVLVALSLFFVIIKGIEFGNDKVTKWLTSLIVSFVSSLFLTDPLQVKVLSKCLNIKGKFN